MWVIFGLPLANYFAIMEKMIAAAQNGLYIMNYMY